MRVIRVAAIALWVVVMVCLLIIARIPDWMIVGLAREISVPRNQSDTYETVAPNRQFREQAIRRRHDRPGQQLCGKYDSRYTPGVLELCEPLTLS
jgi:hypothetical protein